MKYNSGFGNERTIRLIKPWVPVLNLEQYRKELQGIRELIEMDKKALLELRNLEELRNSWPASVIGGNIRTAGEKERRESMKRQIILDEYAAYAGIELGLSCMHEDYLFLTIEYAKLNMASMKEDIQVSKIMEGCQQLQSSCDSLQNVVEVHWRLLEPVDEVFKVTNQRLNDYYEKLKYYPTLLSNSLSTSLYHYTLHDYTRDYFWPSVKQYEAETQQIIDDAHAELLKVIRGLG